MNRAIITKNSKSYTFYYFFSVENQEVNDIINKETKRLNNLENYRFEILKNQEIKQENDILKLTLYPTFTNDEEFINYLTEKFDFESIIFDYIEIANVYFQIAVNFKEDIYKYYLHFYNSENEIFTIYKKLKEKYNNLKIIGFDYLVFGYSPIHTYISQIAIAY